MHYNKGKINLGKGVFDTDGQGPHGNTERHGGTIHFRVFRAFCIYSASKSLYLFTLDKKIKKKHN
jgi:hypothetical protein